MPTPSSHPPRIVIIGGGIAGISLADALLSRTEFEGSSITLIDGSTATGARHDHGHSVEKGGDAASATPMALLNPATGRDAKLIANAATLLPFTLGLVRRYQDASAQRFLFESGVIRPAPDRESADRMHRRWSSEDPWPEGWSEWLSPEDARSMAPGIVCDHGALWIPVGASVEMPRFLMAARRELVRRGVTWLDARATAIRIGTPEAGRPHRVEYHGEAGHGNADVVGGVGSGTTSMDSLTLEADLVLCAAGSGFAFDDTLAALWPDRLGLHAVKGQVLRIALAEPLPFECAVSMRGYLAPIAPLPHLAAGAAHRFGLVVGSTFEHRFDHPDPDVAGRGRLLEIAASMYPDVMKMMSRSDRRDVIRDGSFDMGGAITGWASVRVHRPPDRLPIVSTHPTSPSVLALTGFGSKGLMLAPFVAHQMVNRLAAGFPWRR